MNLSIIIVNWNSAAYTAACISSIRAATHGLDYEIIVVDNASADDSVEVLRAIPDIRLIVSGNNLGFARANNLGYRHSSGDALLFLNPDTSVHDSAITRMYSALTSSDRIGIVGCRLLNSDGSLQTSCVQAFPTILNQLTDIEVLKMRFPYVRMWGISALFKDQSSVTPVEIVSGACLMIRRTVFEQVALFTTDYFMYCEDVDLCYKVVASDLRVCYIANATVVHYGGQSSKKTGESSFADVVGHESIQMFLAKHKGAIYARGYCCSMFLAALVRLLILGVLSIVSRGKRSRGIRVSRKKWTSILSWSLGRQRWAERLSNPLQDSPEHIVIDTLGATPENARS